MSTATSAEIALIEENRRLYSRIAELERERQIPSEIIEKSPVMISIVRAPDFTYELVNPAFQSLASGKQFIGRRFADVWAEVSEALVEILRNVIETGQPFKLEDAPYTIQRGPDAPPEVVHVTYSWIPLPGPDGKPDRVLTLAHDVTGAVRQRQQLTDSITELRAAEKALRESEERFRVAQELSPDGFLIFRPLRDDTGAVTDFLWIYENDAAARMNDTNPKEICGKRLSEILPHHDESPFHKAYKEVAETGEVRIVEDASYDRDTFRQQRCFRVAAVPTAGGDVAVLVQNVTERKRAEEALRESEGRYRAVVENMSDGLLVFDGRGAVTYQNPASLRIHGFGSPEAGSVEDENLPVTWQGFDDTDRPLSFEEWPLSRVVRGERFHDQALRAMRVGTGQEFYASYNGCPIIGADGKLNFGFITIREITAQRKAEMALRESEEAYRALADNSPDNIDRIDKEYRHLYINRAAATMIGLLPEAIIGRTNREMGVPEPFVGMWEERVRKVFETGQPLEVEDSFPTARGLRYYETRCVAERAQDGTVMSVLAVSRDTTERKETERRLREGQKLESLGLLAGGVAHDFNNLLVGVIGNASLAQEMLPPDHPVADLLAAVLKTGEQAAHLTRQMLAYSGKGKFLVEPLNLSALIPDMCGLVRPSISKKIELRLDLEEDLPGVEADRGQLQQVFMNLAINAAEAIGSEGLITVGTGVQDVDEPYLRLHPELAALASGRYVCLDVRDTGCGMDEATKAKIFDPFFSTKFTGRGLGLAAVSGILRGHKSGITVSSAPGKGSCFTVLFPAITRATGKGQVVGREASLQGTGTVLVVDDEQVVRELARRALERHGYTVLMADGGASAIDVFKRHPGEISLVVLDLSMPNMSGEEVLPELRKIRPEVKVVVSSGYSESEAMPLFEGQRVSGFVQKPYTSKAIAEKVKDCLG
ncbi:MAG: PAS domain-containing protein [Acidobacteriia bacterium]|nr:PAS domain-containing protein [Terriglobia bacterium]